ncbi:MAG: ferrous iron transport protein A [Deltaproteobacteria bacterium]|jgi:Fe2+ transport system protein FeoA|nr:ferrous iron transport protein A [Deltaproteobacteria bacterium]
MGSKLKDFKVGKAGIVKGIHTEKEDARRLNSMGIYPGAPIKVITKGPSGCLVSVGCCRFCIEPTTAGCILVA